MSASLSTILIFIAMLQIKHVICDGPLQTLPMVKAKRIYLKPLGFAHAIIHAVGTGVVCLAFGLTPANALYLAALDGVIHYHVDFTKENIVYRNQWVETQGPFWWSFTTDQALHHMTYLLLAWMAFKLP
jgi:hypothetical protein